MAFIGGDILEITWNHKTLGSGSLAPKAAEDNTFDPGGFRTSDDANDIAGNGEAIFKMNRVRWSMEQTCAWDMNNENEVEQMNQLASHPVPADWTITHINGKTYAGNGKPVGDIQGNMNSATFTLKISGGGKLKEII